MLQAVLNNTVRPPGPEGKPWLHLCPACFTANTKKHNRDVDLPPKAMSGGSRRANTITKTRLEAARQRTAAKMAEVTDVHHGPSKQAGPSMSTAQQSAAAVVSSSMPTAPSAAAAVVGSQLDTGTLALLRSECYLFTC